MLVSISTIFKPSPTPLQLVQQQAGKESPTAYIRLDHILNGEVKTYKNGTKVASSGHYLRDPNVRVESWTGTPDANGVSKDIYPSEILRLVNGLKSKGNNIFP